MDRKCRQREGAALCAVRTSNENRQQQERDLPVRSSELGSRRERGDEAYKWSCDHLFSSLPLDSHSQRFSP